MNRIPDNPNVVNQIFLFVPALRRVLRGSTNARCAPFLGTDIFTDDLNSGFNGIPSYFHAKVLGEKPPLTRFHMHQPYWMNFANWDLRHADWPDPRTLSGETYPSMGPGASGAVYVNSHPPQKFMHIHRYAEPGGLPRIMR